MAKYSNTVEYNIKTNLDSSGIVKLQSELSKLGTQFQTMRNQGLVSKAQTREALANIELIRSSLNKAFNGKLGMLDNKAFLANLTAGGKSISSIAQSFSAMGAQGTAAFTRMYGQISRIDTGLKQVSSTSDKIMNTLGNTVRWGLIASAFATVMNAAHQSVEYVKDLDRSLTNIMMVSGETRDHMNEFARSANEVAQRLGGTTVQMTEATKVFIQQGYSLDKSSQLGEYAVHLANVSEQDSSMAADEITAYMNAFKIPIEDMGNAISKWAVVANNAAVSVEELSIASQKAASVASTVGVDLDQFAGHIAAIEAVTREAPENIGNGLKTIYSRIADISLGETLEDGVNLGSFAKALEKVGVDVLDQTGKLRDAGIILEDLMGVWQELDQTQRAAVAKTVAGRFQLARFEALMNRADIYENAANLSRAETGTETYDQMQETYRNSLEGRSKALQAAIEEVFLNAFETDDFYGLVDATTALVKGFGDLIEAIGGGKEAFVALAAFLTKSFSTQIGRGVSNFVSNRETSLLAESNKATTAAQSQMALYGLSAGNANADKYIRTSASVNQYAQIMNPEQIKMVNEELIKYEEQIVAVSRLEQEQQELTAGLGAALSKLGFSEDFARKGAVELALALEGTEGGLEKAKALLASEDIGFLKLAESVENVQMRILDFGDSLTKVSAKGDADWTRIQRGANKLKSELSSVAMEMRKAGQDTTKLTAAIKLLEQAENGDLESTEKLQIALQKAGIDINIFREGIVKVFDNCENLSVVLRENIDQLNGISAAADVTGQKLMGMAQSFNIQYVATQVTNLASAFMSFSFVLMSLRSLREVIKNEDLNPFEKLEQILMNVSMIAVMGIPMIGQVKTGLQSLKGAAISYLGAQTLSNAETAKSISLTSAEIAIVGIENSEKAQLARTTLLLAAEKEKVSIATIQEIASQTGLNVAQVAGIAAANGLKISIGSLWGVFLASPLAPIAAALLAVVAAITALVIIVKEAEAYYHRFDAAVENANEHLKIATEQLKEAKTQVDDINDALQSLDENPFEGLTRGTQEWNQALIEANQNVLDLLEKYPDLAEAITRGEHGELTFDPDRLEAYYEEQQKKLSEMQAVAAREKIIQGAALADQESVNLLRTQGYFGFRDQYTHTKVDLNGNYSSVYNEDEAVAKFQEAAMYVADHLGDESVNLQTYLADLGITGEDAIQEMARLGENLNSNTLATESAAEAYVTAAMSTNEAYQNASVQAQHAIDTQFTAALTEDNLTYGSDNEYVRAAVAQFDREMDWDNNSLQNWYAEQYGYTYKPDKNRFYDSEGEEVEGLDYDNLYDQLRTAYIVSAIEDQFQERAGEMVDPIDTALKNITENNGEELANLFAGNGEINASAIQDLNGDLSQLDLSGLSLADLNALGFGSYDEFKVAFEQASAENPLMITLDTESKYDFDNDEEIDQYLEDNTDIERSTLDTATSLRIDEHAEKGNRFTNEDIDAVTHAQEKLNDAVEEYGKNSEEAKDAEEDLTKAREDTTKDTKLYEKALQRAAAAEARQIKTLKEMGEHFEENAETLSTAEKGSIEYAEALQETKEDLAGLLDVDVDKLSDDFTANAHTLDLMKQSAEGNEEAFRELRTLAAQDIVQNLEIATTDVNGNPINAEEVRDTLTSMIDDLNSQNLGIDVEADVDTSMWYAKVNELLASGAITADQLTQTLSAAGYEAEIDYIEQEGEVPAVAYTLNLGPLEHIGDEKGGFDFPSSIDMVPSITQVPSTVRVPVLRGATQKGGISGPAASAGGGKSGGGGGSCFIAGTLIALQNDCKPIESIKIGDIVLSYNEKIRENEYSIVRQTMIHSVEEELYTLYIEDEQLTATGIHCFLILRDEKQEWIPASDLQINDLVLFSDYSWHKISQIDIEIQKTTVYNFEVSNTHNYYVGHNQILAHNKGGGGGGGGGGKAQEPKSVSKSADLAENKPAEVENDIYEKVNATLEKLQDSYSKLNKVKDRTWGKEYRDNAQKSLDLLVKEQKTLDDRIDIAKKYIEALKTGKSNLDYGIDMTDKESLASLGLKDSDADGVIDNYISKFEEARQKARQLDAEAEAYREAANAEALAYWKSKGGRVDSEGNVTKEASMSESESEYYSKLVEKQKTHYEKLVEKANEQWEVAEKINDVTQDYEETMDKIRDDEEEQLELMHEIEDIQIDLYQRSLDMLDTMHDLNDIAAQMKGFFTGLGSDDPFRALTEGAQAFEDSFQDATYNATAYYNDIIEKLKKEQGYVQKNSDAWKEYNEAIGFYNKQKANAVTNADGLGSGELAQASRKLIELQRWIANPNVVDNPYGTNTQALYEAFQEQYQKVTDAALEAEERMETVNDSIIEAYDKMADQQDELADKYDRIDEQLNRTVDRISLLRGEDAYAAQADVAKERGKVALEAGKSSLKILSKYREQLAKVEEQQEANRVDRIAAAQKEVNRLQKALNKDKNNLDLQQQLATAKTLLQQAKYDDTEEVKWLKEKIDETNDYINDKADEAAEHFKEAYENSIDEIAAQTNDKIFGDRNLDLITNDWGWDKDYYGDYKDNVERTLETEKLRLKYLDLLDNAQGMSLGIQRQIKDAMNEQLNLLENQKTMSEYDVKLANARLEILQKQIALENAQQNKNQMKLRRDTQGNYKYVYAADQDDVRQKQRELLESEFNAYEMSKDANGDAYQKGIALYQQYIEQRTAIEKKYANDVDTMEKELAKLRENYLRAAEANAEDLQNTYDGMIISVQWMAENGTEAVQAMTEDVLEALTEKTQESLEAVGIPWNEAIVQGLSDLQNIQDTVDETSQAGIEAAKEFVEAIEGDMDSVRGLINDANLSAQRSFGETVTAINNAEDATQQLATATSNLNTILGAELGAIDQAKAKIQEYEEQLFAAKESTSALASQLDVTQKTLAEKSKEAEKWKTTYEDYKRSVAEEKEAARKKAEEEKKKAEEAKKKANGNYSNSEIAWGIAQNIWTYGSWGNDPQRHARISERYGEAIANLTQKYINEYWATGKLVNYNSKKWGYASGGYTGTWGKDSGLDGENGKLAFLHQKELVLNQQDTENILEAVQIVRSLMDITKLASLGLSGANVGQISQNATDTIEQRVEITAEFPAANSADDIRQALLNLSDAAMQYAYREK